MLELNFKNVASLAVSKAPKSLITCQAIFYDTKRRANDLRVDFLTNNMCCKVNEIELLAAKCMRQFLWEIVKLLVTTRL